MLKSATADLDIIVADVPEAFLSRVKLGQECKARFLGFPGENFGGIVENILPVLSRERRTLRLLFVIDDPQDKLRPGMFAEIGLGTEPREALLRSGGRHSARGTRGLRAGRGRKAKASGALPRCKLASHKDAQVEILRGIANGDRVIGKGAILLKPVVVRSLQIEAADASAPTFASGVSVNDCLRHSHCHAPPLGGPDFGHPG